jgi:hypothetical protein
MIVGRSPWRRQVLKNGDEYDVVCARKWYCWTQRAGACRRVKQRLNKRHRRERNREIRKFLRHITVH